jgi:hypothetical protein
MSDEKPSGSDSEIRARDVFSINLPRRITGPQLRAFGIKALKWTAILMGVGVVSNKDDIPALWNKIRGSHDSATVIEAERCCTDEALRRDIDFLRAGQESLEAGQARNLELIKTTQFMLMELDELKRARSRNNWLDSMYDDREYRRMKLFERRRGSRDRTRTDTSTNLARLRHEVEPIR